MKRNEATWMMQRLKRKKWIRRIPVACKTKYYTLNLEALKIFKSNAEVNFKAPHWKYFVKTWKRFNSSRWNPQDPYLGIKPLAELTIAKKLAYDWPTCHVINRLLQSLPTFGLDEADLLRTELFDHIANEMNKHSALVPGEMLGDRPQLQILAEPMFERRVLVQVILPLILGLRSHPYDDEYVNHLKREITDFINMTNSKIRRYLMKTSREEIEFSANLADTYLPSLDCDGSERTLRNRVRDYYGSAKDGISKVFAERVISDFAFSKGVRTKFERYATLLGYAGWQKETSDEFPYLKLNKELAQLYMNKYDFGSPMSTVATFASKKSIPGI